MTREEAILKALLENDLEFAERLGVYFVKTPKRRIKMRQDINDTEGDENLEGHPLRSPFGDYEEDEEELPDPKKIKELEAEYYPYLIEDMLRDELDKIQKNAREMKKGFELPFTKEWREKRKKLKDLRTREEILEEALKEIILLPAAFATPEWWDEKLIIGINELHNEVKKLIYKRTRLSHPNDIADYTALVEKKKEKLQIKYRYWKSEKERN